MLRFSICRDAEFMSFMKNKLIERALEISLSRDIDRAFGLQKALARYIRYDDTAKVIRFTAGVDISYSGENAFCSIIVIDSFSSDKKIVEKSFATKKVSFPYIPGLLFYREFPVFFECYKSLKKYPDLLIFDGHGLSHRRMMGIATMAGILLNKPSIGCAKSHLYGEYKMPQDKKFSCRELRVHDTVVGYVLRSKEKVKPIFVSTGYAVSPGKALEIIKDLLTGYKLPLPTHYAHHFSEDYKKGGSKYNNTTPP